MRRINIRLYFIICLMILVLLSIYIYHHTNKEYSIEGYKEKNVFHFHSRFHYGDNIFNLKFFYNISKILKEKNMIIYYYYDTNQIKNVVELERYVDKNTLKLLPLSETPNNSVELWMGIDIDGTHHGDFDVYFRKFYSNILNKLNLNDGNIDVSLYQNEPYLLDIYNKLDDKYKNLDILMINAEPKSGQFDYNIDEFKTISKELSIKYKIATTTCVDDSIPCTMRDNLTIQDIGAISTHAKYIVAVFSGPLTSCFNYYSKAHVKKWIFLLRNPMNLKEINNSIVNNVYAVKSIIDEEEGTGEER